MNKMSIKVDVIGGDPTFTGALSLLDLENPEANGEIYDNWASSVKDFPEVIDQKVEALFSTHIELKLSSITSVSYRQRGLEIPNPAKGYEMATCMLTAPFS